METEGVFSPDTSAEVRTQYDSLESTAKGIVRETVRAMDFDGDEYDERVTDDVIETAQDTLFASRLAVSVGTRDEYESWRKKTDHEIVEVGSEHVEHVVWHAPAVADTGVAATFQDKQDAAVQTLRRQAFGRIYRDILEETA